MKSVFKTALLMVGFAFPLVGCSSEQAAKPSKEQRISHAQAAETLFAERCKKSGVFIHKTAENVEGIYLLKLRPQTYNTSDPFVDYDVYGHGAGGRGYISSMLLGRHKTVASMLVEKDWATNGYWYVEADDPKDGQRYRYTGGMKVVGKKDITSPYIQDELKRNPNFDLNNYGYVVDRTPVTTPPPRYGVTYDDISTREDREHWITGGSLKVIDLKTNEVMAERIGYMMDKGQGNTNAGRSPWLMAAYHACPAFDKLDGGHPHTYPEARDFVEKVLKIKQKGH